MNHKAVWNEYEFYRSEPPVRNSHMTRQEEDWLLDDSIFLKRLVRQNIHHFRHPHPWSKKYKPIKKLHLLEGVKL